MRIKRLTLKEFKGIHDFSLVLPDGGNCSIYADNALGKTTIYDAFLWLLFDKDSLGKKDFEIKTRVNGEVVPMIDHAVEGVFDINDEDVTLYKVYREKYTKKRGSAEQVFDGHETDYFISGVPKSKTEYQKFIAEIAPEELFRLLTSPTHFNEGMTWQFRRQTLLDVCGNVTDSAVIVANPELQPLVDIISKRTAEDEKKVVMSERKKINDELQVIPARIDEATKALPGAVGVSAESLVAKAKKAAVELQELQQEKSTIENGGQVALKRKELADIETAIINLKNKHAAAAGEAGKEELEELAELQRQLYEVVGVSIQEMSACKRFEELLAQLTAANKAIVDRWKVEKAKVFVRGGACQTCGQDYPENLLDVQQADFNRARAAAIESITSEGTKNATDIKSVKESIEKHATEFFTSERNKKILEDKIEKLQKSIASKKQAPDVTELPEYKELETHKSTIQEFLTVAGNSTVADSAAITEKIILKQSEINDINQQITSIEMRAGGEKRIQELKDREQELAKQFEKHEATLFLLEQFTRAKVSMLDEQINGKFELVRWSLFSEQINGGLAETCVCTIDGVPYPSLNNAGRIQAGLDIIKTLSSHHNFSPVVFIDNRESITRIPDMDGQVISLVVSEPDKTIRIEMQ